MPVVEDESRKMNGGAVIFSVATSGYQYVWADLLETQRRYADRIGAAYLVLSGHHGITAREAAWSKITITHRFLTRGAGWVAFFDADCEVREDAPDFRSLAIEGKHLYMSNGASGRLNSGVFFCRRDAAMIELFDTLLNESHKALPPDQRTAYENGHVILHATNHPGLEKIDRVWNNTVSDSRENHVVHYTGKLRRGNRRLPRRQKWLGKALFGLRKLRGQSLRPDRKQLEAIADSYDAEVCQALRVAKELAAMPTGE